MTIDSHSIHSFLAEHFDRLTGDLMRFLAERGLEFGQAIGEQGQRELTTDVAAENVRAPRRAAALRANRAIRQIYRPRHAVGALTSDIGNVRASRNNLQPGP